jgi:hypothetical protein
MDAKRLWGTFKHVKGVLDRFVHVDGFPQLTYQQLKTEVADRVFSGANRQFKEDFLMFSRSTCGSARCVAKACTSMNCDTKRFCRKVHGSYERSYCTNQQPTTYAYKGPASHSMSHCEQSETMDALPREVLDIIIDMSLDGWTITM